MIATKFSGPMGDGPMDRGASRNYIMNAVEASLRRLGTDYIDLYQLHFPDAGTPIDETMRALDDLVQQGKVRYLGHSNFSGWQIANAHWLAKTEHLTPFISAQNQYSLLDRNVEREVAPASTEFGLGVLPFFPLASGLLTGKYQRGETPPEGTRLAAGPMADRMLSDRNFDVVERLTEFAQDHDHTILELAIGWLASQPYVGSVIAGATRPEQATANAAAGDWVLNAEEMAEVDKLARR